MGFDILIFDEDKQEINTCGALEILNLTYNFSKPECKKYWYGPDDMHGKTFGEVIKNLEIAVSQMIEDGIETGDLYHDYTVKGFLSYLITHYQGFIKLPRKWTVKLD